MVTEIFNFVHLSLGHAVYQDACIIILSNIISTIWAVIRHQARKQVLSDTIVMDSHRQFILMKYYKRMFMIQHAA